MCERLGSTHLGSIKNPLLEVRCGRSLTFGRKRAIGEDRGGRGQWGWGWATDWIDTHDQLTFFGETEIAAGVGRHGAQLQGEERLINTSDLPIISEC